MKLPDLPNRTAHLEPIEKIIAAAPQAEQDTLQALSSLALQLRYARSVLGGIQSIKPERDINRRLFQATRFVRNTAAVCQLLEAAGLPDLRDQVQLRQAEE